VLDSDHHRIATQERSALVRRWDHVIEVREVDGRTVYSDTIEIEAGLLTLPVRIFAEFFYRHRQRRWRRLCQEWSKGRAPEKA
jgi:hypothetical protein